MLVEEVLPNLPAKVQVGWGNFLKFPEAVPVVLAAAPYIGPVPRHLLSWATLIFTS